MRQERIDLLIQRGRLLERISMQRAQLARDAQPISSGLQTADSIVAGLRSTTRYLQDHPHVVGATVAVLVVLRPQRVWRWGKRAFFAWRTWHLLRQKIAAL
ncbi:MAG: YqjK-like family protein [Candidatus Accumulibacter sp.]|uniref:YqjK-like family protein n=1 Tax=Accumulibacter sp. TaxID=2053492 RepID=UPI0028796C35|nr:YqjK-like family protein [Accumulibacter sp.]MDS4016294.1 YqjK-like family protein [Accumulibacter sp.]